MFLRESVIFGAKKHARIKALPVQRKIVVSSNLILDKTQFDSAKIISVRRKSPLRVK